MIIVTDGADFIGSDVTRVLNDKGTTDILVVDNLKDDTRFVSPVDLDIAGYMNKGDFLIQIMAGEEFSDIEAIFYEGACSSTIGWDGKYMMGNNYQYSKELLHYRLKREVPFLCVSSAAAYGRRTFDFIESCEHGKPLSAYGYSKLLFDEYVRQTLPEASSRIVGFRYFNVYGSREGHKGSMANIASHLSTQFNNGESPKLFEDSENFKHDLVCVDDVADVNLWFLENGVSGILNLDASRAESSQAVVGATLAYHKKGQIKYILSPNKLRGRYQAFTQADLTNLCAAGYDKSFKTVAEGVMEYMVWLNRDA